jgi:SOS response regulatory protein OraA/RecX
MAARRGTARGGPRETFAERRERRGRVTDVAEPLDAAARFLETRPRSVGEVRRRLASAGYAEPLIEEALARLARLGYLDDEAFARAWVESRDRARPRGERALRSELLAKGVDRALVEAVLAERLAARDEGRAGGDAEPLDAEGLDAVGFDAADAETVETVAARRLLERHRRALLREPHPAKRRQKAYAILARNGFDPDVCRAVAAAFAASIIADEADGDDPGDGPGDSDPGAEGRAPGDRDPAAGSGAA